MTLLLSGYNTEITPCMAQVLQRMYITNDWDVVQVSDDGNTIRAAGLAAPSSSVPTTSAAAGGAVDLGTHLVQYRYYDSLRGRYSNPSGFASQVISTTGTQILDITVVASGDATVTNIIVEMTAVGSGQYYLVGLFPNSSTTIGIAVSDLYLQVAANSVDVYGNFQHNPPPLASICCEHRQRYWYWGTSTRYVLNATQTNGSPTVNAGSEAFSPNWAGREMIGGDGATYQIQASTTSTITLTTNYAGSTVTGTVTVKYGYNDLLGWSRSGLPESTDSVTFARRITLDTGDQPAGMASFYTSLFLFGNRCARRLYYNSDPATGEVVNVPGSMGVFHQRCLCTAPGGLLFGWGRDGIWMMNGMVPQKISQPVETTLASTADPTLTNTRFICYEPMHRQVLFFYQGPGEAGCKHALAYHLDTGEWTRSGYMNGMTVGVPNSQYLTRQTLMLSDINGYSWRVGAGTQTNDGDGSGVVTVTSSGNSTAVGTNIAQAGQYLYRPLTGETQQIASATSTTIVINGTWTVSNPAAGELLYVGRIRQKIISEWFIGEGLNHKQRPVWLDLYVRQVKTAGTKMGTIILTYYKDFDDVNPYLIPAGFVADTEAPGVSIITTGPFAGSMQVDCDNSNQNGYFSVPVPCDFSRSIKVQIIAEQPYNGVRFFDFRFVLPNRTASAKVRNN